MKFITEAKAWIERKKGPDKVVRVVLNNQHNDTGKSYNLYTAFEENPDCLGRILFDTQGYWIYDGNYLTIGEQEQVAQFIINYAIVI